MPQSRSLGTGSAASRSLSVSSDSDALDEPTVLEEARRGSAAARSLRTFRRGYWAGRRRSVGLYSGSSESNHAAPRCRRNTSGAGSREQGSREPVKESGSLEYPSATSPSSRATRVSFVDELRSSTSSVAPLTSYHTLERNAGELAVGDAEAVAASHTARGCRARAVANANRNIAAMAAERRAIHEMQSPVLDAMEVEVRGLHRQLDEVKDCFHKRCMSILNSLVGSKWTIDTSG